MNARAISIAVIALLLGASQVVAQGYAGLGSDAEGFEAVEAGRDFAFPADHAPHPGFRIEWWYVTANLTGADGNAYGAQWTLFRQALAPDAEGEGWESGVLWMGHAAVTSEDEHLSAELFARGGIGQAGVSLDPFTAFIDDWQLVGEGEGVAEVTVSASGEDFAYSLDLATDQPPVLQGEGGYSVKSPAGQASYYYSQPFYEVTGSLTIEGEMVEVTGQAWLDREWSSQPLGKGQEGWDWFALHLAGGEKLMLYQLRDADGTRFVPGTWISPDGSAEPIPPDSTELEPLEWTEVAGREIPTRWRVKIPARGLEIVTEPLNPKSWMDTAFAYWEGPIRFTGSHDGVGYLEMTGYGGEGS